MMTDDKKDKKQPFKLNKRKTDQYSFKLIFETYTDIMNNTQDPDERVYYKGLTDELLDCALYYKNQKDWTEQDLAMTWTSIITQPSYDDYLKETKAYWEKNNDNNNNKD